MFAWLKSLFSTKDIYFRLLPYGDKYIVVTNFNPKAVSYENAAEARALMTLLDYRKDNTGNLAGISYNGTLYE